MKNIAVIFICLSFTATSIAKIITVDNDGPADFNNIQAAIDDSNDGDTVEIQTGTYTGPGNRDIDIMGKSITIRSVDPNDPNVVAATIVDCNSTGGEYLHGFYYYADPRVTQADVNFALSGLTIANSNRGKGVYLSGRLNVFISQCVIKNNGGGGIYVSSSGAKIDNCVIRDNGGIGINASREVNIENCIIKDNRGNGIYANADGVVRIDNCIISGNSSNEGGGINSGRHKLPGGYFIITNCTIKNNISSHWNGGGIRLTGIMSLDMKNCIITGNSSVERYGASGGGIFCAEGKVTITNCILDGNSAEYGGGGIACFGEPISISCCTFIGNTADRGGAIYCTGRNSMVINNCILWGNKADNGPELALRNRNDVLVRYSDLQYGPNDIYMIDNDSTIEWSADNINIDPCFADPGYWDVNETPDDSNDDFWVAGDYHLKSQAGRWGANEGRWVKDDVTSPCIDSGDPLESIDSEPFPNGGIVNMGAYGGTSEASKSYFGKPPCETIVAGDINGDCVIDYRDFIFVTLHWLENNTPMPPGQASSPGPFNGATGISTIPTLSWQAGEGAESHNVYFGTESPGEFQGNQTETTFSPGTLIKSTTYYWRIDEVNADGKTPGPVWSFTTTESSR